LQEPGHRRQLTTKWWPLQNLSRTDFQ